MTRRLLLGAALLVAARATAAPPPKLSLAQLVQMAAERSRLVQLADAELEVRRAQKRLALSQWAPIGELTYLITAAPAIECRGPGDNADPVIRKRECVNTVDPATGNSISTLTTGLSGVGMQGILTFVQPVYTFGKIENAVRAAGHGIAAGQAQVEASKRDSGVLAGRAYWGLKAARTSRALVEAVIEELSPWIGRIAKDLDATKPRYTIGDLSRVKTGLVELKLGLEEIGRIEDVARAGMRILVSQPVDVDDAQLDPIQIEDHPIDYYQDTALSSRPEVRALTEGVAAYRSLANLRRSEMLPDLGILATVLARYAPTVETPDNVFVEQANTVRFGAFFAVRQPIDIAQRFLKYREAQRDADVWAARRALLLNGVDFEISDAYARLSEARKVLADADDGQKIARGWLTAVQQTLDLGIGDTKDLADAARQYVLLRLRYYQAIHDVNVALMVLRRASGLPLL